MRIRITGVVMALAIALVRVVVAKVTALVAGFLHLKGQGPLNLHKIILGGNLGEQYL
jgi:hypothetical protein